MMAVIANGVKQSAASLESQMIAVIASDPDVHREAKQSLLLFVSILN
jgi:hypothetical protein